jgi:hypothetical protein
MQLASPKIENKGIAMADSTEMRDGIEQIREVLFGATQRELERRLARVESHFVARLNEVQQESRKRTEVIEAHMQKSFDTLAARTQSEIVELTDALRGLTRERRDASTVLEQRIAKAEESLSRVLHELRQQILDQAKTFLDELQHQRAELTETMERELESFEAEPPQEASSREPRERETEQRAAH